MDFETTIRPDGKYSHKIIIPRDVINLQGFILGEPVKVCIKKL